GRVKQSSARAEQGVAYWGRIHRRACEDAVRQKNFDERASTTRTSLDEKETRATASTRMKPSVSVCARRFHD
ncbi:hypothetical protein CPAR01_13819, partial [Colletotrichum paranaense]